jgi:hypothetical protein
MTYSVNLISTQADCDLLLSLAAKEKSDLEFQKLSQERQRKSYAETAGEVAAELQTVDAELTAITTVVAALPDGEVKDDSITRQKRLELRKRLLDDKKDNYGVMAVLEKELGIDRLDKELAATQDFIVAIQARKAAL